MTPPKVCDVCGSSPPAGESLIRAVDTEGAKLRICGDCADDCLNEGDE